MEDMILREIDKIGKVIAAILCKIGLLKRSDRDETVFENTKAELLENLNLDLDALLEKEDFIEVLVKEYGFSNDNLEQFAELLTDFAAVSGDRAERVKRIARIGAVYTYLERNEASFSVNRYSILKELEDSMNG